MLEEIRTLTLRDDIQAGKRKRRETGKCVKGIGGYGKLENVSEKI